MGAGIIRRYLRRDFLLPAAARASHHRVHSSGSDVEFAAFRKNVPCGTVWVVLPLVAGDSYAAILWRLSFATRSCGIDGADLADRRICGRNRRHMPELGREANLDRCAVQRDQNALGWHVLNVRAVVFV